MFASLFIIGISVVMFGYWFRYTCLLLLQTRQAHEVALNKVVSAHGLKYRTINVHSRDLTLVEAQLQRDYRLLRALLMRSSAGYDIEALILRVDFILMQVWWRLTRRTSPRMAARAMQEMIRVLDNWAMVIGVAEDAAAC